jgi:hypothetical protein
MTATNFASSSTDSVTFIYSFIHLHPYRQRQQQTLPQAPQTQITIGSNDNKLPCRTAVAALDISKAFDSIDHTLFIEDICNSILDSNLIRWISAYLHGRTASCNYNGYSSQLRNVKSGFPQGSVLFPDLCNSFISDRLPRFNPDTLMIIILLSLTLM